MKYTSTTERAPLAGQAATTSQAARFDRLLLPLIVGLAALLPRIIGLADFFTTDEAYHWISRTERFVAAVGEGRWADTILTGHPGVTLMWLGGLGLRLEQLAVALSWAAPPDSLGHLAWLRAGPVLAHAAALTAGYLLLRRLVRPELALVAALLWATSPFLVAHGRLLHLDALLTDLCTLSLLATLVACRAARPWPWLLGAGALCGLALLTKGPALIMLPAIGLTLFALGGEGATSIDEGRAAGAKLRLSPFAARLRWSVPRYLVILAVAAATVFLLWPALWAAPERAIASYVGEIVGNGGRANGDGQFFLGRRDADPGPLFYPLAGLYRLTPVELLGLALLPLALWQWARVCSLDPAVRREQASLIALGAFALFWALVMTAGPKKFDRYVLPLWPALLTLSAAGLMAGWGWLRERRRRLVAGAAPIALLLALQAGTLAWYHPYYLSYYSPLLGGGPAAQRMFLIGWGEGMDQVGAWLRGRPDISHGQILSALPPTLQPFVPVPVQEVRAIDAVAANYAVAYLESLQRGDAPEIYGRIMASVPLHTVTIHGIEYARIYQLARPYATPVGAEFGGALRLLGYSAGQAGGALTVTPAWDTRGPVAKDLTLFLFVFDAAGNKIAQIDVPPGGASAGPTSQWQPGEQHAVPLPIALPAGLPAGEYTLALGLYEPGTWARLPLTAGPRADPSLAGPDAALLGTIKLSTP
ncbi:MAG: phospholipid carrier-dependent glycosyltransferase [Chloroflexales bacterium]|nr:phospholipid carrier-dependent glycosyltransferase [Chloroflexales bacterium]